MSKKKDKTDTAKKDEYSPVYITLNASNNPDLVGYMVEKVIQEAAEYNVLAYLTVNSGNPPNPPKCPPGMSCQD